MYGKFCSNIFPMVSPGKCDRWEPLSKAVIAKEKDLQKAFGTVDLPEPLGEFSTLGLETTIFFKKDGFCRA